MDRTIANNVQPADHNYNDYGTGEWMRSIQPDLVKGQPIVKEIYEEERRYKHCQLTPAARGYAPP